MVGVSASEELTGGVHGEKHKVFSLQSKRQERHDSYVGTICQRASVKV